jgi:hypothetical protein
VIPTPTTSGEAFAELAASRRLTGRDSGHSGKRHLTHVSATAIVSGVRGNRPDVTCTSWACF